MDIIQSVILNWMPDIIMKYIIMPLKDIIAKYFIYIKEILNKTIKGGTTEMKIIGDSNLLVATNENGGIDISSIIETLNNDTKLTINCKCTDRQIELTKIKKKFTVKDIIEKLDTHFTITKVSYYKPDNNCRVNIESGMTACETLDFENFLLQFEDNECNIVE